MSASNITEAQMEIGRYCKRTNDPSDSALTLNVSVALLGIALLSKSNVVQCRAEALQAADNFVNSCEPRKSIQ